MLISREENDQDNLIGAKDSYKQMFDQYTEDTYN